jgi:hypothetical protein
VDSNGLSGGLLSSWKSRVADISTFLTPVGILLEGSVKDVTVINGLKLFNCCGPYTDREAFGGTLKNEGLFNEPNLILGGDLNFTTSSREV